MEASAISAAEAAAEYLSFQRSSSIAAPSVAAVVTTIATQRFKPNSEDRTRAMPTSDDVDESQWNQDVPAKAHELIEAKTRKHERSPMKM